MKELKAADELLTLHTQSPEVRFVERSGQTIVDVMGRSNPWSSEQFCDRVNCKPCSSRTWLQEEADREPITMPGELPKPKPGKEDTVALPGCTVESVFLCIRVCDLQEPGFKEEVLG